MTKNAKSHVFIIIKIFYKNIDQNIFNNNFFLLL